MKNKQIYKWFASKTLAFLDKCYSKTKTENIDVIIPTTDKDLNKLTYVIPSLSNIAHNIDNIYIVAPQSEFIINFCAEYKCKYINEDSVLPIKLKDIKYTPGGKNRAGWIFQQLLKLNSDKISENKYILVIDSDTVFTRKQYFIRRNKMVFDCSNEYHGPYFETYKKIIGLDKRFDLSFVAHHMLFKSDLLAKMKQEIEARFNKPWYQVILDNLDPCEQSSFSEYETYGNWMYYRHRDKMLLREWYNFSTTADRYQRMSNKAKSRYKTVSMHSYNEKNDN